MGITDSLIPFFAGNVALITFIATYIGGVETIILLGFLSGQGVASFNQIFLFAWLGYFLFEITWFFIAKTWIFDRLKKRKKFKKGYSKIAEIFEKLSGGNDFLALFAAKFVFGFGTMLLIYLSRERLSFKKFFIYDLVAVAISTYAILSIGWFAGTGYGFLIDIFENVQIGLFALIVVAIIFHLVRVEVRNYFIKKKKLPIKIKKESKRKKRRN